MVAIASACASRAPAPPPATPAPATPTPDPELAAIAATPCHEICDSSDEFPRQTLWRRCPAETFSSNEPGGIDGTISLRIPSTVVLTGDALDVPRTTESDAEGRFTFDAVPPGTYTIALSDPDGAAWSHDERCIVVRPSQRTKVTVRGGPCVMGETGTAALEVTLLEEGLGPRSGVEVAVLSTDLCSHRGGVTDETGQLRVTDLVDGNRYVVIPSMNGTDWKWCEAQPGTVSITITWPAGTKQREEAHTRRARQCDCRRGWRYRQHYKDDWPTLPKPKKW
jgi:hypothetical protein